MLGMGLVFQTLVWCCSNGDVQDAPLATRASSSSSGEQEPHSVQGEPQAHTAHQQQQQQQQQQGPSLSSVTAPQPGSQSVQQLASRSAAEGLMRVNSPGPAHPFDAAAYAAAAAARTSSPGQLAQLLMWSIPSCMASPRHKHPRMESEQTDASLASLARLVGSITEAACTRSLKHAARARSRP